MTATYTTIRDTVCGVIWAFRAAEVPAGLVAFGHPSRDGARVFVCGTLAGQVAMDWLRDRGIEPVRG